MSAGTADGALPGRVPRSLPSAERAGLLATAARRLRASALEMVKSASLGHLGGDFSATDILTVLLLGVVDIDPADPRWPERDRFIMSKGHASASYYAALAACGYFEPDLLKSYMAPGSPLNGHPDAKRAPGVEANTGPLGHGLPIAVGIAISAHLDRSPRRTFCLVGDGELQEGSNWEAMMSAGHRGLDRLTVIVDRNGLQQGAATEATSRLEPLADKAASFGFAVAEVDGHDHLALLKLFEGLPLQQGKPNFVIARTHKGYPVSFMVDRVEWHHRVPTDEEYKTALEEIA
jgi:transketolase